MISTLTFLYGLVFGSFYNVVGLRVPVRKSIVKPRSACSLCGHQLTTLDLIPVVSYIILKGQCRKCEARISPIYPLTELITALLFLYAYLYFGLTMNFFVAILFISMLIVIVVSDLAYMLIPDKIMLFFFSLFLIARIIHPLTPWWDSLFGAVAGYLLLLIIAIASKGGMGGGDVKLFAVLGFVMGAKLVLLTFFLSCVFGAVIGLVLLIFGIVKRGKPMPFGPYIAMAAIVSYFYGGEMIHWYLQFF
ncbi:MULTISPECIES: A24 family peptidase [Bacillaceae]|uniref:Prepilin peptidase n=1 Tax=Domibacillus aminovorans TaxID=29332 RepID=A0A177KS38_9BACI|nr:MULTISPECIES: A24 family peptidase [Bacillaceae]OAH56148.1 prepilin peptidase [Domibacillus aminovorans]